MPPERVAAETGWGYPCPTALPAQTQTHWLNSRRTDKLLKCAGRKQTNRFGLLAKARGSRNGLRQRPAPSPCRPAPRSPPGAKAALAAAPTWPRGFSRGRPLPFSARLLRKEGRGALRTGAGQPPLGPWCPGSALQRWPLGRSGAPPEDGVQGRERPLHRRSRAPV